MRSHRNPLRPSHCAWRCLAFAFGLTVVTSASAVAQVLLPGAWQFDGEVLSLAKSENTLYAGGWFRYCGPFTGPVVGVDPASGARDESFPTVVGQVWCASPDGQGGWFLGGNLQRVGNVQVEGIAHVRADRTVDDWAPRCGLVESMRVHGNRLYIGGGFTTVDDAVRIHAASFDLATLELLDWAPAVEGGSIGSGEVLSIAAIDSTVFLGGWFGLVNGEPRATVAAVHAQSGQLLDWDPGSVDGAVLAMLPLASTVLIAGQFDAMGGAERRSFAEVDRVTGLATSWSPLSSGGVNAIVTDGTRAWVGGYFTEFAGESRANLVCVDLATHAVTPWDSQLDERVQSLAYADDRLYVTGEFTSAGGEDRLRAAAFEVSSGNLAPWNPCVGGPALVAIPGANAVLLAGSFQSVGGVARRSLAAIDLTTGRATDWAPSANNAVRGLDVQGGTVYAVGDFSQVDGVARPGVVALDAESGAVRPWNPGSLNGVAQWVQAGPAAVYIAGFFSEVGGIARRNLAALDPVSGAVTPWDAQFPDNAGVSCLGKSASRLYLGGNFASIGGQPRGRAAAFDLVSGALLPWNPQIPSGSVLAIAEQGSEVYLGGYFFEVGGQPRQHFAVVDQALGAPGAWSIPLNASVRTLALGYRTLFLGGEFTNGYLPPNGLAAWDLQTHVLRPWMPVTGWTAIRAMRTFGDTLAVGGSFSGIAGSQFEGLALFRELQDSLPPLVTIVQPGPGRSFVIGQQLDIRWNVSDESPLVSQSVYLSRSGPGGPWAWLGYGVGQAQWTVTGPLTNEARLRVVCTDLPGNVGEDVLDWSFRIVSSDSIPPQVRVTWPNGYEELPIGSTAELRWLATDNVEVTRALVSVSRTGPDGPWVGLVEMYPSWGMHPWLVTGPPSVLSAWMRVDAWDAAGNVGSDVSDHAFSILDGPVPTLVELFQAVPTALGARLEWRLSDPARFETVELQRSAGEGGEWVTLARPAVAEGQAEYLDTAVPAVAFYRLALHERSGSHSVTTPIRVESEAVRSLVLFAPAPNPSRGEGLVSFGLPRSGPVRLVLLDAHGRERGVLAAGLREAGRHVARLEARDLQPGLYFLHLVVGDDARTKKFVIVR